MIRSPVKDVLARYPHEGFSSENDPNGSSGVCVPTQEHLPAASSSTFV